MKKKIIILAVILIILAMALVMFIPTRRCYYDDGGTCTYTAPTYQIVVWNTFVTTYDENGQLVNNRYHKTSVFWYPDNQKSIDELWEIECATSKFYHDMMAEGGEPPMYEVAVDWSDFIKLDGIFYIGDCRETEVSADRIGEKIGEVTCGVPKIYTDGRGKTSDDIPDDGASFLCEIGTELFSVNDTDNAIAALVDGKYYIYTKKSN